MCQPRITVLKCIKYDFGKLATHGHSSWLKKKKSQRMGTSFPTLNINLAEL